MEELVEVRRYEEPLSICKKIANVFRKLFGLPTIAPTLVIEYTGYKEQLLLPAPQKEG